MKNWLLLLLAGVGSGVFAAPQPKNIILVIGDGMGPEYTTAYRMVRDDINTPELETTIFDQILVGMASTHPDLSQGYVTDSAAAATALSAGVKTYNGAIGVDVAKKPVETVLEFAKKRGLKTGIAVTSQINHATPAGFSAHDESRNHYNAIADSYFDQKITGQFKLDVMLGGGWKYFIRPERNLVKEFQQAGYQYIDDFAQLGSLQPGKPVLGLFADVGLPWALDTQGKPRLPAMVKTAVKQLENDKGFFLLVEGSQIDWGGHANDIAAAMGEMHDLGQTLQWLSQYVDSHPDTLFVVTADHSTGGMTIGARGNYNWHPEVLRHLKHSPEYIANQLPDAQDRVVLASEQLGFALDSDDQQQLNTLQSADAKEYYRVLKGIIDKHSVTGWTTGGHTGIDVQIFAKGQGSELFAGHLDNTQIALNIFKLLGK